MGIPLAPVTADLEETIEVSRETETDVALGNPVTMVNQERAVAGLAGEHPITVLRKRVGIKLARESGLFMLGKIRPKGKCPECGGQFVPLRHPDGSGEVLGFYCPVHKTEPKSLILDARQFRDKKGISPGRLSADKDGKKFRSCRAAYRQLEAMRQEVQDGKFDASRWSRKRMQAVTLAAKVPGYVNRLRLKYPSSHYPHQTETRFLLHILPEAGDDDFRTFSYARLEEIYVALKTKGREKTEVNGKLVIGKPIEGLPPGQAAIGENEARGCLRVLKACLNDYLKQGELTRDQVPLFPPTSPVKRIVVGWAMPEEQAMVLSHVPESHGDARPALEVLCETGARRNVVVCAVPTDLIFEGHIYLCRAVSAKGEIKDTKTGVDGKKPLTDSLYARLVALGNKRGPREWLFQNSRGGMLRPDRLTRIWKKAACKAGFPNLCLTLGTRHSKPSQINADADREKWERIQKLGDWTKKTTPKKHYVEGEEERLITPQIGTGVAPRK